MDKEMAFKMMGEKLRYPDNHYVKIDREIDKDILECHWHRDARFLFIERENGTQLTPLGIHPILSSQAEAVIESVRDITIHLVDANGVKTLSSVLEAKKLLDKHDWRVDHDEGAIYKFNKLGQEVAKFGAAVKIDSERFPDGRPDPSRPVASVLIEPVGGSNFVPSVGDAMALRELSIQVGYRFSRDVGRPAKVESVMVRGVDLDIYKLGADELRRAQRTGVEIGRLVELCRARELSLEASRSVTRSMRLDF